MNSASAKSAATALNIHAELQFSASLAAILTLSSVSQTTASEHISHVDHLLTSNDAAVGRSTAHTVDAQSMIEHSVTQMIADLKAGDPDAAERLASRYFDRLVTLARKQLGTAPRRVADEEDIAISVFQRLCVGADEGRFPKLQDREDLWAVLLTVTKGKVADQIRHLTRKKRGGGEVRGHSVLGPGSDGQPIDFAQCVEEELTPDFIAQLDEEYQRLLKLLRDDTHRNIAVWRMEGYSNSDIADRLQISVKSVERKLRHIREKWASELP